VSSKYEIECILLTKRKKAIAILFLSHVWETSGQFSWDFLVVELNVWWCFNFTLTILPLQKHDSTERLINLVMEVDAEKYLNLVRNWHYDPKLLILSVGNLNGICHLSCER